MNNITATEAGRREAERVVKAEAVKDAINLRGEAYILAKEVIALAKETAKEMLLEQKLDTSAIPLICNRIDTIKLDVAEIKDNMKWYARTIIGTITLAVIALVMQGHF